MRWVMVWVGVAFALGFLCLPFVAPPTPNEWWVSSACASVCLLVSAAAFEGRMGRAARWTLGGLVLALAAFAVYEKLAQPVPEPFAQRWGWPWGWVRALALALVFAWSAWLHRRKGREAAPGFVGVAWWEWPDFGKAVFEARGVGGILVKRRVCNGRNELAESRQRFVWEFGMDRVRSVGLEEARAAAVEALWHNQRDGAEAMDEATARRLADAFIEEALRGRPFVRASAGTGPDVAGVLIETKGSCVVLAADDALYDEEDH